MAERDGYLVVGAWVRLGRNKGRASEIFVEIGTADAYIGRGNLW